MVTWVLLIQRRILGRVKSFMKIRNNHKAHERHEVQPKLEYGIKFCYYSNIEIIVFQYLLIKTTQAHLYFCEWQNNYRQNNF